MIGSRSIGADAAAVRHRRDRAEPRRLASTGRWRWSTRRRPPARRPSSCRRLRGDTLVTAALPGAGARRRRRCGISSASSSSTRTRTSRSPAAPARTAWRFISTPFCEAAVDMLERVGVDAYKIASGDLTSDRLIDRVRRATGKPLIMSTGMSTSPRSAPRVAVARRAGAATMALLHCVSAYPVPAGSENLRAIATLARAFACRSACPITAPTDRRVPIAVALGAVALRAPPRAADGDDGDRRGGVSSTPAELAATHRDGRPRRAALGRRTRRSACRRSGEPARRAAARCYAAARRSQAGDIVRPADIVALRPSHRPRRQPLARPRRVRG